MVEWGGGTAEGQKASPGQTPGPTAQRWERVTQQDSKCLLLAEWVQGTADGQHANLSQATWPIAQ